MQIETISELASLRSLVVEYNRDLTARIERLEQTRAPLDFGRLNERLDCLNSTLANVLARGISQ
ncbi:hypothetical protein R0135_03345 [Congregibacter variabilis]|uniref:Uncharacterized protein n=1 Tax=Congregibacter variabilis TaxID=3081200 RepID=A0ABZ0I4Z7_9GAMM|nr:hypothetical protein R0135_03345 [Congregibacter sp. IMCC43200]